MKVQVHIKSKCETSIVELVSSPADTILSVKERVTTINNSVPASLCSVIFNGTTLTNEDRLGECGIREGAIVELVVDKQQNMLVQQLKTLLQTRDLTLDELAFMYNYRYGSIVTQVLRILGFEGSLKDFVQEQKELEVAGGFVKVASGVQSCSLLAPVVEKVLVVIAVTLCATQKSASVDGELPAKLMVNGDETVATLKKRAAAAELIPFDDVDLCVNSVVLPNDQTIYAAGLQDGSELNLVVRASEESFLGQLHLLLQSRPSSIPELSLRYSYRHGATVARAMQLLGRTDKFKDFVMEQNCFVVERGCVLLKESANQ